MNGLYFDRKSVKIFTILLAIVVVASIGVAAFSHFYFGHETQGKDTEFTDSLTLGSSFTLDEVLSSQNYGYKWVRGDNVEIEVFAESTNGDVTKTEGILQYDSGTQKFNVIGVSGGHITFTSTEDRSVKFTIPFKTIFNEPLIGQMITNGYAESSFVTSGVMTATDLASMTKLETNAIGEVDFSDLKSFTGIKTLIFTNPSDIVKIKDNSLPDNIDILVSSSNVGDYSNYYRDSGYLPHIFANTDTEVSVNCIANGGTFANSDTGFFTVPSDSAVNVTDLFAIERKGYIFGGWVIAGTTTEVSGSYQFTENTALEARWQPIKYTVQVNYDNGTGTVIERVLEYDQAAFDPFLGSTPIYDGYSFRGWSLVANSCAPEYPQSLSNITQTDGASVVLHAVWVCDEYKIRYNVDSTHKQLTETISLGNKFTVSISSENLAILNGLGPFLGWTTDPSVHSAEYVQDREYDGFVLDPTKGGIMELYPVFNEDQYTIVYWAEGGSRTPASSVHQHGDTFNLSTDTDRRGYKLVGWKDNASGKTYGLVDVTPIVDGLKLELHAVWSVNKFNIELRQGSTVLGEAVAEYGNGLTFNNVPHSKGYVLSGSYNGASIGSYQYSGSIFTLSASDISRIYSKLVSGTTDQEFSSTSPVVIQMNSSAKVIKVTFYEARASGPYYIDFGSYYYFPDANPPSGYHFEAWVRSDNTVVNENSRVNLDYDHSITAKYEINGCFTSDATVMMADYTEKGIADVHVGDMVLAFDHFSGEWVSTPVIHAFSLEKGEYSVLDLHFDDGSTVSVYQAHGFYDLDTNRYEMIDMYNVESYLGDSFVKMVNGNLESVTLVSYENTSRTTTIHSIITASCINSVCYGMISVPDDLDGLFNIFEYGTGMVYDSEDISESLALYGYEDYSNWSSYLSEEEFYAFNGMYANVMLGKGLTTMDALLSLVDLLREEQ